MLRTHRHPLTLLALLVASLIGLVAPTGQVSADAGEHATALNATARTFTVGYDHACLLIDQAVWCWGDNNMGQTGTPLVGQPGGAGGVTWPTAISSFSDVVEVSAGKQFTCALKSDATVWCWGDGQSLATGNSGSVDPVPTQVLGATSVTAIAAGYSHTCAIISGGGIKCWGQNASGQLGNSSNTASQTPVSVSGITNAVAVAAGQDFTCAVLADGGVRCWGYNMMGQVGNGSTTNQNAPATVQLGSGGALSGAVAIALGDNHACAVTSSKGAYCWGENTNGELGAVVPPASASSNTSAHPMRASRGSVSNASDIVGVAGGDGSTCILRESGAVACFGYNSYGQVGNGLLSGTISNGPDTVLNVSGALAIGMGRYHACAVTSTDLKCWGDGYNGQRGDGSNLAASGVVSALPFRSQGVTFGSLSDAAISSGSRTVSATSTSGAAVTFSSTTTSVCTVSGSTVTYVSPGTCTVKASRGVNGMFLAAADVSRSFSISGNKPTARTAAATSVSASRATLNAVVNPSGLATTVKFVYGLKSDLSDGNDQASRVDTSMNDTDISVTVTGLAEKTTYYYRVEATNEQGTSKGDIMSFTSARPVGVTVNDAAEFTNKRSVTVSVTGPTGSAQAILSNDGGFSNSKTFTLTEAAADIPWTLVASKDERLPKVVYVKFVSRLGSASTPYQDDIILDTTAPAMTGATGAATSSSSGAVTVAAARGGVRLTVRASDKNSGIGKVQVKSSASGKISDVATGSPKATSRTVRVNTTKKRLWVRVVDRAGNPSKWVTVTVK
jgi:alpha-tubulin suppressor-like RCC1 family protein